MGWLSGTWTRTIVTILVTWVLLFTIQVGKAQGWYPKDPTWLPCTTWPTDREPCVLDDGALLANFNGRFIVYPKEGE